MRRLSIGLALVAGLAVAAGPAWAQRPHGTPPGLLKNGGRGPGDGPSTPGGDGTGIPAGSRVRSLGAWLDDATAMGAGEAWMTVSVQQWSSPIGDGLEAPVMDLVAGVRQGVHLFASVPYSRTTYTGLPTFGEMGTLYLGGKVVLREPDEGVVGFAAAPAVEILSASAVDETGFSRVNLVLPVSVEWRHGSTRVYGSSGYFTRGAVFGSGAVEHAITDRSVVTLALSQGWATGDQMIAEELGLRRARTDLSGSLAWVASPHLMLYGGLARTISPLDADAIRYAVSVGASMNLRSPGRRIPVKKP
jgi:hypothetical protein